MTALNLNASDFELFGLTEQFAVDLGALDARWKSLQREIHPDRFAADGAVAQRLAMQWSVRVNEAYQRLKNPQLRAAYLCERRGVAVDAERNTAMPAEFLMQQMEWREQLDEAQDADALDGLDAQTKQARQQALAEVARLLDIANSPQAAVQQVRALMFIDRFATEVGQKMDQLEA